MIDTSNLDFIGAKIEAIMDKKLFKLKLAQGSSNISVANEATSFFMLNLQGHQSRCIILWGFKF